MTLKYKHEIAIQQVKLFIDSHPLERTPLNKLILRSGLSEDILTKGFKELWGERLYHYQLRVCMVAAGVLLQQGFSVKSVALAARYKAQGNFTRAFFNVVGMTPSQYQSEKRPQ